MNASLVSGLNQPYGIAVSGSNLFVANYTAAPLANTPRRERSVNASLVSGLVSRGALPCLDRTCLSRTTATARLANTPRRVDRERLAGLGVDGPHGIAVSGSNLFVTNDGKGTIGEYTTSGAVVNASLVSGLE